jgi:hypothetical protein
VRSNKQGIVVSRSYDPVPDHCARALALLLKEPVSKEGGPPTAPDDAKGSKHDRATKIIPKPS